MADTREPEIPIDPPRRRDPQSILDDVLLPGGLGDPGQASGQKGRDRVELQGFRPIVDSLEWKLSRSFWAQAGLTPFLEGVVPYLVNNSGWAAGNAAATLFANCCESVDLPEKIVVLELGAGLGLFAHQVLDEFHRICTEEQRDFYDRLLYIVTDGSPRTIEQWNDCAVFAEHRDHVLTARCDAENPSVVIESGQVRKLDGVQAVFANYILDSLPVAIVRRNNGRAEQLCVRTYLSPNQESELRSLTGLSIPELAELAQGELTDADRETLLHLMPYLEFETDFRDDGTGSLSYLNAALPPGTDDAGRRIHNYGGIRCLEECVSILHAQGFVLLNDFGPPLDEQVGEMSYVSRFGSSLASSLNFPQLERHFSQSVRVLKPEADDGRDIHTRLLVRGDTPKTDAAFLDRFRADHHARAQQAEIEAVQHIHAGRLAEALGCYRTAIRLSPRDWNLLGQASQFLCQQAFRHQDARDVAEAALNINPWFSAFLWNTLGNSLYCLGEHDEAHATYLKARAIDPKDTQTNLNLAFTLSLRGEYGNALLAIARGLESDRDGRFEPSLLRKQREILGLISTHRTVVENLHEKRQDVFRSTP